MEGICPVCGTAVAEDDLFCGSCGHKQDTKPASPERIATSGSQGTPHGAAATPPHQPSDSYGSASDTQPVDSSTEALVVQVPGWLASDWANPAVYAALALTIGAALQYAVSLAFLIVIQLLSRGFSIDWGETLRAPLTVFLSIHGPIENLGLWATGIVWIWLGFYLAARQIRPESNIPDAGVSWTWGFALKTAAMYAIVIAILAAVFEPTLVPISTSFGFGSEVSSFGYGQAWNVAMAFFLSFAAATLLAAVIIQRRRRVPLGSLVGLERVAVPRVARGAAQGGIRTMLIALPSIAILLIVGTMLDWLSFSYEFLDLAAIFFSLLLAGMIWAGIDVAFAAMVEGMSFFTSDTATSTLSGDRPFWAWGIVLILIVAFVLGGIRAAEKSSATTTGEAMGAGALVGPVVGVLGLILSWFVIGVGDSLTARAVGLALLWSLGSALGGFIYANQRNLPGGVKFQTTGPSGSDS